MTNTTPLDTAAPQLPPEIEEEIIGTFSFLVTSAKKDGDNYCVHDQLDNCFNSIEEIQEAVRLTVKSAIKKELSTLETKHRAEVEEIRKAGLQEGSEIVLGAILELLDVAEQDKEMADDPEDPKIRVAYLRDKLLRFDLTTTTSEEETYGDGHYCTHHPDDPAHDADCYKSTTSERKTL